MEADKILQKNYKPKLSKHSTN